MDIKLTIDDILRGQGVDPEKIASRKPILKRLAETALEMGIDLIVPQVFTNTFSRDDFINHRTVPPDLVEKSLEAMNEQVDCAISYSLTVCTIGDGLECLTNRMMTTDFALAMALDGMANAAIDQLVEGVFQDISEEAASEGLGASLPISPGSHSWPLEIGQPFIFGLLKPDPAVLRLNANFLMLPKKSVSFIVGVGPEVKRHGKTCDYCSLAASCRYRIRKTL
jgi:hypothetical protein